MTNIQFRFSSITALKTDLTEKANIRSGIHLQGPQVASAQALDIITRLQKIGAFLLAALATLFTGFDRNWKKATREVALQVYTGEVYTLSHLPQFPIAAVNPTPSSEDVSIAFKPAFAALLEGMRIPVEHRASWKALINYVETPGTNFESFFLLAYRGEKIEMEAEVARLKASKASK